MRNLKKVLALVLALVMTMSLVTIANAADFSDSDKISYEEAVDVMTAIGVIEGLDTGAFNPTGTLTREQAAAIICRMMLGDNADKLGTTTTSFKDVASTRWSASYISYCASLGIIAGNGDGTYSPAGTLTGYAFAKMLLGALGYKADVEGFVGAGWNLKVAAMASKAGLLNDLQSFVGSEPITREEAAQMALNTLKATLVEYNGTTIDVSSGDANVTIGNTQYSYVTSNNGSINKNIDSTTQGNSAAYYTLEFGEQHFPNLKLVSTNTTDDFGRPANQWSLSNVTIGKYAKVAAFEYTAAASGATTAEKVKNMGLKDYRVAANTYAMVNGETGAKISSVNDIPALSGNGVQLLVYTSDTTADLITHVVVIKTQLMQIDRINETAKLVSLKKVDTDVDNSSAFGKTIKAVDEDNDCYEALASMKADDYVLVTYIKDGNDYVATSVAAPTVVTGNLTRVSTNKTGFEADGGKVNGVTVAGTAYSLAANRGIAFRDLDQVSLSTSRECTLYVDSYGYGVYIKDVAASTNYMFVTDKYTSQVNGRIVTILAGIGTDGSALTLNIGTSGNAYVTDDYTGNKSHPVQIGDMVAYQTANSSDANTYADYSVHALANANATSKKVGFATLNTGTPAALKANQTTLTSAQCTNLNGAVISSNVKVFFMRNDGSTWALSSTKDGMANVSNVPANSYAIYTKSGNNLVVSAIYIGAESDDAVGTDLAYVSAKRGAGVNDTATGRPLYYYTVYVKGVKQDAEWASTDNISQGSFITYTQNEDGKYTMRAYTNLNGKATSVAHGLTYKSHVEGLMTINETVGSTPYSVLNTRNAIFINDTDYTLYSLSDYADFMAANPAGKVTLSVVYNDLNTSDDYTKAYYVVATSAVASGSGALSDDIVSINNDAANRYNNPLYYVESGAKVLTDSDKYALLASYGCTDISVDGNGKWSYKTPAGLALTGQTVAPQQVYKLTVDTTLVGYVNAVSGGNFYDTNGVSKGVTTINMNAAPYVGTGTGFMYNTNAAGTMEYATYASSTAFSVASAYDLTIKTGYVTLTDASTKVKFGTTSACNDSTEPTEAQVGTTVYFKLDSAATTITVSDGTTITPVLVSGTDKAAGAVYRFTATSSNVTVTVS